METDIFECARLAGMSRRQRQNEFRRRRRACPEYRARENAQNRARRAIKRGAGDGAVADKATSRPRRQFYDRRFRQWVSR